MSVKTCTFPECDKKINGRGLCSSHASQRRRTGRTWAIGSRYQNKGRSCSVDDCSRPAASLGICSSHRRHIEKYGETRAIQPVAKRGEGTVRCTDGYRFVQSIDDPYYPGECIGQHRLVMAHHLERRLLPGESVHHRNGDRLDNRLSNLELWSESQPSGQRVEDKVAWAKELLSIYEPDLLRTRTVR